jgi:predicted transcriptional regulator
MFGSADSLPDGVLEAMAHLSRSENRMRILHALTQCPFKPRDLTDRTDIPRSTARRIVTELIERGWVERTLDGEYVATPLGDLMAAETERYIEAIGAIQSLDSAVSWLPEEELTVDLHHFGDARIIGRQMNDAVAPDTYAIEQIRKSNEFRSLTNIAPTLGFESAIHEGVEGGTLSTEHIVTPGVLPKLRMNKHRHRRW